jgi:type IV pilus assembly protein PilB
VALVSATLTPDPTKVRPETRFGDLVVERVGAPRDRIERALVTYAGRPIGQALLRDKVLDEAALTELLGLQLGIPVVDLATVSMSANAHSLVSEMEAHFLEILPIAFEGDVAEVAVADPLNPEVLNLLRRLPASSVRVVLAAPSRLRAQINRSYSAIAAVDGDVAAFTAIESTNDVHEAIETIAADDNAPVVQVVNKIVRQALRDRASDVHIEPSEDCVRVRYRVDGALNEVLTLPADIGPALVSRLKIMASMNIVERRRPQDGQFEMTIDGRGLDVRVSTTATIWGEKTVLRLLDRGRSLFHLTDLGMRSEIGAEFSNIVRTPFGMVIVSGPTGSGKTTTLYATLSDINRPDMNVMTIEDPVEYVFPKVNQIQINDQAGMSFASGLKSILRQDPDVILVGEVRDVETARIAVQSALTGHLVLSSMHAIDSVSALHRLLDMGVEPFLVTSAVIGVVAQRLVRRTCTSCATTYKPSPQEKALYRRLVGSDKRQWVRGEGCAICAGTGYYDRVGVYEVLTLTDEVRESIVEKHAPRVTRELAVSQGMSTLQQEAMRLVQADVTTVDEVARHVFGVEDSE